MSQVRAPYQIIDVPNESEAIGAHTTHRAPHSAPSPLNPTNRTDDHRYQPESGQIKEESNFADSSGPVFNMYLELAEKEDERIAESWKADADGILVFTGLFSAAVAALIAISIQPLQSNPQDTSAFYLQNIYQLLADRNISISQPSIPATLATPPAFAPPKYAVWVNSLWFLSLAISLTCALLATLLKQWARRYLKVTRTRYSPHKRARIREFFSETVEKLHLPWAVEALPALLHLSLFLFFAGLLIFLFNINHTVFSVVVWWVGFCGVIYGWITLMPILRPNSPYYSPLSSLIWLLHSSIQLTFGLTLINFGLMAHFEGMTRRGDELFGCHFRRISNGIAKTAENTALDLSSEIDGRALIWTIDSLDEDHELERFFKGILGFLKSTVVENPQNALKIPGSEKMSEALIVLVGRTWSSNLIDKSVKQRRMGILEEVMALPSFPIARGAFRIAIDDPHDGYFNSVDFAHLLMRVTNNKPKAARYSRWAISKIIARCQERDDRWFELATNQLGISRSLIEKYLANGDSLHLANLIQVTRDIYDFHDEESHVDWLTVVTLEMASRFDIQNTLPELQNEFCDLWNRIRRESQGFHGTDLTHNPLKILFGICRLYAVLHEGTSAAPTAFSATTGDTYTLLFNVSSYPQCNIPGHHPDSSSQPH